MRASSSRGGSLPLRELVAVAAAVATQSVFKVAAAFETQALGCVEEYDPEVSYFTDTLRASPSMEGDVIPQLEDEINFANDFSITYFKAFKVVRNFKSNETFVLYLCGTPKPDISAIEDVALPKSAKMFEIPVKTIATAETVSVNFLEHLDLEDKIVFGPLFYTSSPCVQKLGADGNITQIAGTFPDDTEFKAQMATVDLVFISNFAHQNGGDLPNSVTFDTSTDPGALNRLEWIKFMSTFTNDEAKANEYMKEIVDRYECTKKVATDLATSKTVAFISISSFFGNVVSQAAYKIEFIEDAGGVNPFTPPDDTPGASIPYATLEELALAIADVDVLIDESYAPDPNVYTIDTFKAYFEDTGVKIKAIEDGQVWREDLSINSNGGMEWFESPFPQPDALLQEMLYVLQGPQVSEYLPRVWLRHLSAEENPIVKTPEDCDLETTPDIYGSDCSVVNFMHGFLSAQEQFQAFPDVNLDSKVDILDVIEVLNLILGKPPSP